MRALARLAVAIGLVFAGFALSPHAVPIYDGIGTDEPYRFVVRPPGASITASPTEARATSPIRGGMSQAGLNVTTTEVGPQFSLFVPIQGLAVTGDARDVEVAAVPQATVSDPPVGTRPDGNAYLVTMEAKRGVVSLTPKAVFATVLLRSTTAAQPPPVLYFRPTLTSAWTALPTTRSGNDIYSARFPGAGQFQLSYAVRPGGQGASPWPYVALGAVVIIAVAVITRRLRPAT